MPSEPPPTTTLIAIRAAHHAETTPKYDRVVFEFRGPLPLLQIEYVKQLISDGSGLPIPIAGSAILHIHLTPAHAHNDAGQPTAPGRLNVKLPTVKEIVCVGDFEGVVIYGIGLAKKAETRMLTLANPSRLVIDVIE
jgi:hypothetical protein